MIKFLKYLFTGLLISGAIHFCFCITGFALESKKNIQTSLKRYSVLPYQQEKVLCEPYTVSKDDWLYKIFRKKGDIAEKDFPLFLDIFKKINPGINNIDAINPGQQILIPLRKIKKDDYREVSPGVVDVPVIQLTCDLQAVLDLEVPNVTKTIEPFIKKQRIKKGDNVSELIDSVFLGKYGGLTKKGLHAFKLANPLIKNHNLIYAGSFINLPDPSILLQPWFTALFSNSGSLDLSQKEDLSQKKDNSQKENLSQKEQNSIHPKPIKTRHTVKINSHTKALLNEYASKIDGNLLCRGKIHFPQNNDPEFILDLASTPVVKFENGTRILFVPETMSDNTDFTKTISSFWKKLKIMDIKQIIKEINILPENHEAALIELLKMTEFNYTSDSNISFALGDVNLNASVGKIPRKGKTDLLVNFGNIYGKTALEAIKAQGFEIISILPRETTMELALKLFTTLGFSTTDNPAFVSTRTRKSITISGLYVKLHDQNILLADQRIDSESTDFLKKNSIRVLYVPIAELNET